MADYNNQEHPPLFGLDVYARPACPPRRGNGGVIVGVIVAAVLILLILASSGKGAAEPGNSPVPVTTSAPYQMPYQLPNGGGGPPRTPIPTPGK